MISELPFSLRLSILLLVCLSHVRVKDFYTIVAYSKMRQLTFCGHETRNYALQVASDGHMSLYRPQ